MSIATLRDAMGTALRTIPEVNTNPYMTDTINTPQIMVDFNPDYDLVFSGTKDTYNFTVQVYTARTVELSSQLLLDTLRDPNNSHSVKQTLESNATLATACDYAWVRRCGPVETVVVGNTEYLRISFDVEVVA